eukprot:gene8778-33643_t
MCRFDRLANSEGEVSIPQFQGMVELGANPFISRIFEIFDADKNGALTKTEFTDAIMYFCGLDDEEEQYKFAFRIYDVDGDGYISREELFNTLNQLMGAQYSEAQLEQVVHNTMTEFDTDGDNMLDINEFKKLLHSTDLQNKLAISM